MTAIDNSNIAIDGKESDGISAISSTYEKSITLPEPQSANGSKKVLPSKRASVKIQPASLIKVWFVNVEGIK